MELRINHVWISRAQPVLIPSGWLERMVFQEIAPLGQINKNFWWSGWVNIRFKIALNCYWIEKRLSDDRNERRKQIKLKQKFASYNKWYGETLEGNLYKAETIIVESSNKGSHKNSPSLGNDVKCIGKSKGIKVKNPHEIVHWRWRHSQRRLFRSKFVSFNSIQ